MLNVILAEIVVLAIYMSLWFVFGFMKKRFDVADTAWGPGFVVCAVTAWCFAEQVSWRNVLVTGMTVAWALRLAVHIGLRSLKKSEDARYRKLRQQWAPHENMRAFFQIFLLQAVLILVISAPVTRIITAPVPLFHGFEPPAPLIRGYDIIGFLIWLTGFMFESVSDIQLTRFKQNPKNKGRIIRTGLWRYSRHPNYFGEVLLWWGIYVMAAGLPYGWITVIGPVTISFLIIKVSGIPLLEDHYRNHPDYQRYRQTTSVFFPLPPRKEK